jgi:hypothetical protein
MAHKEPATPLGIFRILVALVLMWDLMDIALTGAMEFMWFPPASGGFQKPQGGWLWAKIGGPNADNIRLVFGVAVINCLLMIIGFGSRLAALINIQCAMALFGLHPGSGGGHDRLITNALWIVVLSPADTTLSLWSRLKSGNWVNNKHVAAWPRYLAIYQVVLMYTCTGIQKLGAEWWPMGNYLAIYYALLIPYWARADWIGIVSETVWLTQIASAMTWLWESTWWLVLVNFYYRKTHEKGGYLRGLFLKYDVRRVYLIIGLGVHVGIAIAMNLGPFSAITLSYYVCCIHHDEWRSIWNRVLRKRGPQSESILKTVPEAKSAT